MATSTGTLGPEASHLLTTVSAGLPFHASSRVNSIADAQSGVRKLLTRKPDQRVARVPPHLKEQFLNGDRNSCQILQEYCQVRRMKLSYEEVSPPDMPGMEICWWMRAIIDGVQLPSAPGKNKKLAKQEAAEKALKCLFDIQPVMSALQSASMCERSTATLPSAVDLHRIVGSESLEPTDNFLDELRTSVPVAGVQDKVQSYLDTNDFSAAEAASPLSPTSDAVSLQPHPVVPSVQHGVKGRTAWDDSDDENNDESDRLDTNTLCGPANENQAEFQSVSSFCHKPTSPASSIHVPSSGLENRKLHNIPFTSILFLCFQNTLLHILKSSDLISKCDKLSGMYSAIMVRKWTPASSQIVAIGSGYGHLSYDKWPPVYLGTIIHDCHSIVIARRAFVRYLYMELNKHLEGYKPEESIFKPKPDDNGRWSIKGDVSFHIIMTETPCGAASSCSNKVRSIGTVDLDDSKSSRSDKLRKMLAQKKHLKDGNCNGHLNENSHTEREYSEDVCFKNSGAENPFSSLSCSDKMLRWNYLGWEGSLLGCFINPIFMSSLTFTDSSILHSDSRERIQKAVVQRNAQVISNDIVSDIPVQFRTAPVLQILAISEDEKHHSNTEFNNFNKSDSSDQLSLNWCRYDKLPELINPSTGRVSQISPFKVPNFEGQSRICKKAFLNRFTKHLQLIQSTNNVNSYREAKKMSLAAPRHYTTARKGLIATFNNSNGKRLLSSTEKSLFVNF